MRYLLCASIVALFPCVAAAQTPVIAVPEKIKAEGLPPIPQTIADDLSRYANFREAQFLAWHPTKQQILIQTTFGAFPQLHVVDGPGRARTQLTFFPDGISREFAWARFDPADGATVLLRKDTGGGKETNQLFRYDVTSGATTLVTDGKSRFGTPVWSRQGKWIAYDSTERNGRDHDLYVMQPADPKSARRIVELQGAWEALDWSPDGAAVLALEQVGDAETYLWRVDVKTGERKPLTPRGQATAEWADARFSADGRSVYAISDKGSDRYRLWRGDVASGAWTALTSETDAVDRNAGFDLSSDGLMIAIVFDRGSRSELQVLDVGTMKPRPLAGIPVGVITRIGWRPNSKQLAFTLANVKMYGDVFSVDASLGTLDALDDQRGRRLQSRDPAGAGSDRMEKLRRPRDQRDSLQAAGEVQRAPAGHDQHSWRARQPLAAAVRRPQQLPVERAGHRDHLSERQRVVGLRPEIRTGRQRPGARRRHQGHRRAPRLDCDRPELDKNRVMLTGASYGGYLTLQAAIEYNDRIRCAYEAAGMTNLVAFLEETDPSRQAERRPEYGDERDPQMRAFLTSISPMTRAAELKKPVAVIHPSKDTRIPVGQAADFAKAVRANGTPVWYLEYTDVGHDNFPGSRAYNDFNFYCWVLFVKTYLLN